MLLVFQKRVSIKLWTENKAAFKVINTGTNVIKISHSRALACVEMPAQFARSACIIPLSTAVAKAKTHQPTKPTQNHKKNMLHAK